MCCMKTIEAYYDGLHQHQKQALKTEKERREETGCWMDGVVVPCLYSARKTLKFSTNHQKAVAVCLLYVSYDGNMTTNRSSLTENCLLILLSLIEEKILKACYFRKPSACGQYSDKRKHNGVMAAISSMVKQKNGDSVLYVSNNENVKIPPNSIKSWKRRKEGRKTRKYLSLYTSVIILCLLKGEEKGIIQEKHHEK